MTKYIVSWTEHGKDHFLETEDYITAVIVVEGLHLLGKNATFGIHVTIRKRNVR